MTEYNTKNYKAPGSAWTEYCNRHAQEFKKECKKLNLLHAQVRNILSAYPLPTWHNPVYHNFSVKLYWLKKRFSGKALNTKIAQEIYIGKLKKLRVGILRKITKLVLNFPEDT
ncbi:MAG: hypothetical protein NZ601_05505 [candidate division WOR-3 bacterium]|nr:hypothetical protein [candidate division WOR-3 bacterium]MCX7756735.1 hypothetical protein [candidate division WOR-3 bacterium]MDW7987419.1 hypothetical protein [candidate division WOR-3 bacterium]